MFRNVPLSDILLHLHLRKQARHADRQSDRQAYFKKTKLFCLFASWNPLKERTGLRFTRGGKNQ